MWLVESKKLQVAYENAYGCELPKVTVTKEPEKVEVERYDLVMALWETEEWVERLKRLKDAAVYLVGCTVDDQFVPFDSNQKENLALKSLQDTNPATPDEEAVLSVIREGGLLLAEEIAKTLRAEPKEVEKILQNLLSQGLVQKTKVSGQIYYEEV